MNVGNIRSIEYIKMSRFAKFKERITGKPSEDKQLSEAEVKKQEEEIEKGERAMKGLLERVILRYYHRALVGEVEINHSMVFLERSLVCEIDGTDGECPVVNLVEEEDEIPLDDAEEPGASVSSEKDSNAVETATDKDMSWAPPRVKAMVKTVGGLLNRLEKRAYCYRGQKYAESLTLSGSAGISDPFGVFSVSITCSATVPSLIASYEKKKASKASS